MVQETSAPGTIDTGPDDDGSIEPDPAGGPVRAETSARGVPLGRLLSVVVLNPAQATLVAARLLAAVHRGGTGNGSGPADAALWTVTVTASGDVEVARSPVGQGLPTEELLGLLSRNARRLPAHPRPEQLALLRRLEEAVARPQLGPDGRAHELDGALEQALGPGAGPRLSRELAALVAAFTRVAPSVPAPASAPAPAPTSVPAAAVAEAAAATRVPPRAHRAAPARPVPARPWHRRPLGHRRTRPRRVVVLALLLAAVLAGSGYVALRDQDDATDGAVDRASGSDSRAADPPASGTPGSSPQGTKETRSDRRQGVESLAARQAGAVTGVELRREAACTPGTLCPVTVTVRLQPAATARAVTWRTGAARWCRRGAGWSPPITVTAQPGWTSVYATTSVPVPPGPPRALVALTSAPARVQSPPVPVTGSAPRC